MPQIFHYRANALTSLLLVGIALTMITGALLLVAVNHSPWATAQGSMPRQPVPFSHEHHVGGLGIDCRYCHTGVENSSFAGLPDTHTCMSCHSQIWTGAQMLAPVRESLKQQIPLVWTRVHDLADFVYFDHRVHIHNGVGCESCHGRVDTMPLIRQAAPLTMEWCLDCHRDPAPRLRPAALITAMGYRADQGPPGQALLARYDIQPKRLSECVTCHR